MDQNCSFCTKKGKELVYSTKYFNVFLEEDQTYLGRCTISTKEHIEDLSNVTKEKWLDFSEIVKYLEKSAKNSFGAIMFNWACLMNLAYQREHPNPHVHWHFRPRYNENIKFENLEFKDKEFSRHYEKGTMNKIPTEIRKKIIKEYQKLR